jgi:hypothetical protein
VNDTERLEFLMQFFTVDDIGCEEACPGVIVDTCKADDMFNCGALAGETVTYYGGWENPDMRRVIDKAIEFRNTGKK